MERIRVLTLNLYAEHADWERRRAVVAARLHELRPDLIAFQEAVVRPAYDQAADVLPEAYHVHHHSARADDGAGCTVATVHSTTDYVDARLDVAGRAEPAAVAAVGVDLPAPFGRVWFVHHNAAWELPYEPERELQAVAAARFVDDAIDERDAHVLLAGDFNAGPDAASVRFWAGAQSLEGVSVAYRNASAAVRPDEPGHTFSRENALVRGGDMPLECGRRIDYVFVRCAEHGPTRGVASCELVFSDPVDGLCASDHFGVVADHGGVDGSR